MRAAARGPRARSRAAHRSLVTLTSCALLQTEVMVLERFGRFKRILTPGLHFVIPLVDTPRECHWMYIDARSGFRVSRAPPY